MKPPKKNNFLAIVILIVLITGFYFYKIHLEHSFEIISPSFNTATNTDMQNTSTESKLTTNSNKAKIQAWIYPGDPACKAESELQDGRHIDVIKTEYFTLDNSGNIKLTSEEEYGCNGFSEKNIEIAKSNSSEQFATFSGSQEKMQKFFADKNKTESAVQKISDFVTTNNITGAEIDFEDFSSWTANDYSNYKKFATSLGTALHAKNKKLIVDGPAIGTTEEQGWYKWKYEDFNSIPVDYITVMAYDYQNDQGAGSAIAPNDWVKNIVEWAQSKIKTPDKLVIGIPSYGYVADSGSYIFKILTREQISSEVGLDNFILDQNSFEYQKTENGKIYEYVGDDSLTNKKDFIEKLGIKNISVWHLGGNGWFK